MKFYKNKYAAFFLLSIFLIICLSPFASEKPDGLEWVAGIKGFLHRGEENPSFWKFSPMPDYAISFISSKALTTILSGLFGLLLTTAMTLLICKCSKGKKN